MRCCATAADIQQLAICAFQAIDGSGLARGDFFLERKTERLIVNEINMLPDFTSIGMYPKLREVTVVSYSRLLDRLIELAFQWRHEKSRSLTSYE